MGLKDDVSLCDKALMVSYQSAKLGRHGHCGIGGIMISVYHMILPDHLIKRSFDFMGRSPSR